MRSAFLFLCFAVCAASVGFNLFSVWCATVFFSKKNDEPAEGDGPPGTILKSVRGVEDGTYENLASFCRIDYPAYQVLFGVHDSNDPAIPLIARLLRDFPQADLQLIRCDRVMGSNPKVSNLIQMEPNAKHPLLLVCDSDIRVGREFLRRLVRPMREKKVGAVTCMSRSLSKGFIGTLEALREVTEFCPSVMVAHALEGVKFGLGSAILVRREALEEIGGFASIADYLADDYLLGNRIARAGYAVHLSNVIVEHDLAAARFRDLVRRQIRWNRGIRACRPWGYRGLILTYGIPMGGLFLALSGFSTAGWIVFTAASAARLTMAYGVGARLLNDRAARRYLWLTPVQDVLSFGLWCAGLFGSGIQWRDQSFRLMKDGKLHAPIAVPNL